MIPTHVFVDGHDIERGCETVIHFKVPSLVIEEHKVECGHIEPRGVYGFPHFKKGGEEGIAGIGRLGLIGDSPEADGTPVLVPSYHLRQHPLRLGLRAGILKVYPLPDRNFLPKHYPHLFCKTDRIFVLRIMCKTDHVHAESTGFGKQHHSICLGKCTALALGYFLMERYAPHECRLAVDENLRPVDGNVPEADGLLHPVRSRRYDDIVELRIVR